jgi:hypothetical protein
MSKLIIMLLFVSACGSAASGTMDNLGVGGSGGEMAVVGAGGSTAEGGSAGSIAVGGNTVGGTAQGGMAQGGNATGGSSTGGNASGGSGGSVVPLCAPNTATCQGIDLVNWHQCAGTWRVYVKTSVAVDVVVQGMTWAEGKAACAQVGMLLPTINNAEEDACLPTEYDNPWLGLVRTRTTPNGVWDSGSPSTYRQWGNNPQLMNNAGVVWRSLAKGGWMLQAVGARGPVVCEAR